MRTQFGKSVLPYLGSKFVQNQTNTEGAQVCKTQPPPKRAVVQVYVICSAKAVSAHL